MSVNTGLVSEARIPRPRMGFVGGSILAFALLTSASWGYVLFVDEGDVLGLFSLETWRRATSFLGQLAGASSEQEPAFLQMARWTNAWRLAYETLAMSVLAIAFAGIGALLTFLPAARNVARGELAPSSSLVWPALYFFIRGIFILTRGIPELIWAMLIIFVLSPGVLPGALALGLHNYGILGKLSTEVVEGVDIRPARALRTAGAGNFQMLAYGILPQVLPQFFTYILYRWEVVIRTTVVVGFVGTGGLGREFRLAMSWFHYTDVALLLLVYLLLVVAVDLACAWLRRQAR
jgi:phosphonate transport system permease protein